MSNDYVFDIETYPNVFTLAVEHADAPLPVDFDYYVREVEKLCLGLA